jgi:ABC-type molybdate transport system substrate-binding protein
MVLLKQASPTVTQFYAYLQSKTARVILRKHGYEVPQ